MGKSPCLLMSTDWFSWEIFNRKPLIFPLNMGLSGFNFPLIQSIENGRFLTVHPLFPTFVSTARSGSPQAVHMLLEASADQEKLLGATKAALEDLNDGIYDGIYMGYIYMGYKWDDYRIYLGCFWDYYGIYTLW